MPTSARVAVVPQKKGPLSIVELKLPDPGPHDVLIKQFASGVCYSQLHLIHSERKTPLIVGHESTGVVLAKGKEVTHVAEGDHVMVTWVPRNKAANPRKAKIATLKLPDGTEAVSENVFTWADHTLADEQYVVRAPKDVAQDVTAIIGCAVMTGAGAVLYTAGVKKGESVAVFGVGGVGLCAVTAAKMVGANPIIAVDLDDKKLEFARKFGATVTVNASKEDPVKAIQKLTTRDGVYDFFQNPVIGADYAFDCIGRKVTMEQILPAVRTSSFGDRSGGLAVVVGVPMTNVELNAFDILANEKKFMGSCGGTCRPERDFPIFLEWYKKGQLDLNALITKRFKLDQVNEAVAALDEGRIFGRAILEF
jgi:Zn-dependent alcohol dehydrogenase